MKSLLIAASSVTFAFSIPCEAADPSPVSAGELASRLSALRQNGSNYVRLRMEMKGAKKETLQVQIKERRSKTATDIVYQVLWPKERKGESVLLRKNGSKAPTGTVFLPPNTSRHIDDLKDPLLGSDLSYEDVIDDFFGWERQTIIGTETVDGVACQVLESKPGKGDRSSYAGVRSWVDMRRMMPLRVEKYGSSGQVIRRIDTTRVVSDSGRYIPANLEVRSARQGSVTDLDGSRIKHDVVYTDRDFSPEGLQDLGTPRGSQD